MSLEDKNFYIGCTNNLRERIRAHNSGQVESTRKRLPIKLIYYEACLDKKDGFHREKYLKTTYGGRYLKNRLKVYFTG
jgi:putative endonuclease